MFARFLSLRVLYLHHLYKVIDFGREQHWELSRRVDKDDVTGMLAARVESALLWCTFQLVKRVATLESFFVKEEEFRPGSEWLLSGWVRVCEGRDVMGALRVVK